VIKPESLGFSSTRLAGIDRFLNERYIETGRFAGTLLAISRRGELVHQYVAGLADRERNIPMREDTIFRLYSMTKPLTSVAFMMLVEEGLVCLNDPVHAFIPSWRDLGVFVSGVPGAFQTRRPATAMRVVDLLRHTSGLTYGFQMRSNIDAAYRRLDIGGSESKLPIDRMIELLATVPLEYPPGETWCYSISTDVLGYLAGIISGMPFEQFLRSRLLEPLGMNDTDFFVPAAKHGRLAACYVIDQSGAAVLYDDPAKSRFRAPFNFISGGGGLVGTAADYLKFCHMLVNGGAANGHRFLAPKTVRLMAMNHLPGGRELTELSRSMYSEAIYSGLGFGLGFAVVVDRARTMTPGNVGEYFWGGSASTAFWIDPRDELAVVFLTQLIPSSAWPIRQQLRALVYAAMEE
jgi:CubicO group peptidase (beta-lactamase class C family)